MKKIDITPQELCERLFNGESFYHELGAKISYNKDESRFEEHTKEGDLVIFSSINFWIKTDLYTKPHWTDNLSEESPVLCWLRKDRMNIGIVKGREAEGYTLASGQYCSYAEPVKLSEACIWEESNVN